MVIKATLKMIKNLEKLNGVGDKPDFPYVASKMRKAAYWCDEIIDKVRLGFMTYKEAKRLVLLRIWANRTKQWEATNLFDEGWSVFQIMVGEAAVNELKRYYSPGRKQPATPVVEYNLESRVHLRVAA